MSSSNSSQERLKRNVVTATSESDLDVDLVNSHVNKDAFAAIRGVFSSREIEEVYPKILQGFDASLDQPSIGDKPGAVMRNFQKISIGGAGNHWDYRPRFMRVIYNPLWEPDKYGMHAIFRKLAAIRNVLQGNPPNFAIDKVENGLWTAARMQHYPTGGGNISRHRDAVISTVSKDAGVNQFHQMLLLLTSKGEHFEQGGAFMELNGERMSLEEEFKAGDIVVYDGTTMHGVEDIDPGKVPRLDSLAGRIVALVSLYKDMSNDSSIYAGYENTFVDAEKPPDAS